MDAGTDGQRENSIPTTNKVCRGHNKSICVNIMCSKEIMVYFYREELYWADLGLCRQTSHFNQSPCNGSIHVPLPKTKTYKTVHGQGTYS